MSYCRFSSDDYDCDLYCYESIHSGYITHVASSRLVSDKPKPDPINWPADPSKFNEWRERYVAMQRWLDEADLVDIGLPHDGESFYDADLASMIERVEGLKALGYRVPDHALAQMREELEEERKVNQES